jgi:hypothetical protein
MEASTQELPKQETLMQEVLTQEASKRDVLALMDTCELGQNALALVSKPVAEQVAVQITE